MIDQPKASRLAREAFDLWQAGELEGAVEKYREAFEWVDPDHFALADYHGEFAAVLASLGRDQEALEQYRRALTVSARLDPDGPGVAIDRYFLSELLLKMNDPDQALEAIGPVRHGKLQWLAHVVESDALWRMGRLEESKAAALLALDVADSEQKRTNVRERLRHVLDSHPHAG
jgi:tetratricopeptide (TPR) repeat protein